MKKRSKQIFKSAVSFVIIFLMVISSVIQPSSKTKADGFPNDATGVSPDGKYYSAGKSNRLGMVTSDESHTPVELFGFCMANSKKYPGYDTAKDEYFGVYEQMLNLNKESFNKLVRDNHLPGKVATSHDELWDKVSKLIYIYLKDPTDVIGRSGWATPQDAINEFYTVVQNEIWRYTDGYKVDKDSNQYWFYKYSKQGQKAVYLLREAVDSINVPADFELRGYKPEKVKNQIVFQAIVTGRLKKLQPVGEIKTTVTAGGKTSTENEIATLKAKDIEGGVEVSDKVTYKGLYPNVEYDVEGKIYEVKDGKLVNPDNPVSEVNGSTNLKPDATGKGEWTLNFGKLNLEAGKSYVVFEKVVSLENVIDTDGDGKPDKKQELTHEDPKDKSQTFTVLPKEEVEKEVVFSKVNVGGEEIAGAKIQIKDEQGNVVKEWTSKAGQSETIKLKAGTYIFHEEAAPNGYLKVTDITFEVDEQGKVTVKNASGNEVKANGNKLTVTDKTEPVVPPTPSEKEVVFSKVNVGGEEIAGAKIQIKDEQGNVVKEWTSKAGQSETIKLKAGTYIFHEEAAPNGYLKVTDITFEVDEQGKVTVKNANGNEVKANGNKLTVTDKTKSPTPETPWTPMIPSTRNLKVTKKWLGTNGNKITAPVDKIEVELYKDGKATGQKLELNKANSWTGEFKDLKAYESIENSKAYEYTVKEVGENNNSIKLGNKLFKVTYSGNMKDKIEVVNTESPALSPSIPSEKPKKSKLAKTGIGASASIYSGILAISGGIMLFLKKRNQK
ncbi:thioester-forming surface-anchored protein [Parvimonas micra]|uniref:thioester-forming surface-anchored protein n=1 Tax=Parvimonas micra TaxID=33033 RepID=UPI002B488319|nr:thioester-forming surface-anchored protein [Parvimonas micra]MEB3029420.1 thioester-forming surface-anchored protein [Parvimonas micra]